ncbi:hypothetical protein [Pelagibius sp.]
MKNLKGSVRAGAGGGIATSLRRLRQEFLITFSNGRRQTGTRHYWGTP